MKKYLIGLIVILMGLNGCASKSVELTESENDMVGEYVAGKLLEYNENYGEALIYEPVIDAQSTPEPTQTDINSPAPIATIVPGSDPNSVTTTAPQEYLDLSEVFASSDFEITYSKCDFYSSYPKESNNSYFTFEASKDNQLIIVEFDIKNITNQSRTLNLIKSNIKYEIIIDDKTTYSSLLTVLENDISYYNMKIGAEKSKKAVLAFEVPKNIPINSISLYVSKEDKIALVKIK